MNKPPYPPVGYKNPPLRSRFRTGEAQSHRKRKANEPTDVHAFFTAPISVKEGEITRKIHPCELAFLQLVQGAIKGDMRKAALVIDKFDRAGLLTGVHDKPYWPSIIYIPVDWDSTEWDANLRKYGPPPWPLERDGVARIQELRDAHNAGR
jgi:hypothetical protein